MVNVSAAGYQRHGVGRRLIEALVALARQLGLRRLWVDASVTAAPFSAAEGFVNLGAERARLRGVSFRQFAMEQRLRRLVCSEAWQATESGPCIHE